MFSWSGRRCCRDVVRSHLMLLSRCLCLTACLRAPTSVPVVMSCMLTAGEGFCALLKFVAFSKNNQSTHFVTTSIYVSQLLLFVHVMESQLLQQLQQIFIKAVSTQGSYRSWKKPQSDFCTNPVNQFCITVCPVTRTVSVLA